MLSSRIQNRYDNTVATSFCVTARVERYEIMLFSQHAHSLVYSMFTTRFHGLI